MAIIQSMGVGRAKKSMGNVTYRTVRGRTIGSQKRLAGATGAITRGQAGNLRKPLFAMINMFMANHSSDIQVSFNKSKYGSQRNYFFKTNYTALTAALRELAQQAAVSGVLPLLSDVETAITTYATANPSAIYRVKLAGFADVFLTGEWSAEDNPISGGASDGLGTGTANTVVNLAGLVAPIALSLTFHSGAKIVHGAGTITLTASNIPADVTVNDIQYLGTGGIPVTGITVSEVSSFAGSLKYEATAITANDGVLGVKVKGVYIRLTSAYVSDEVEDPLG